MRQFLFLAVATIGAFGLAACGGEQTPTTTGDAETASDVWANAETVAGLSGPGAFLDVADETERSQALFTELHKVVSHPRCMNCHPRNGGPTQGDNMEPHNPPVVRGTDNPDAFGMGAAGMQCSTCHGDENVSYTGAFGSIPGHAPWALAPITMGWVGLSATQICANLKNPDLNGGRSLDAVLEHHAEDGLVGWAWDPGKGRTPAPGNQEVFGDLTAAWIETGAHCPEA